MKAEYTEDHIFYAVIKFSEKPAEDRITELVKYFYDIDCHYNENIVNVLYKPNQKAYVPNEYLFNFLKSYLDVATIEITLFNSGLNNPEIFKLESLKCNKCKIREAMHNIYYPNEDKEMRLCCKCYVEDGNAPSDWHPLCIETKKNHE